MSTETKEKEFHGLSLHVTVFVAPTDVEKFFSYLRPAYEKVAAEPECTFFEVFTSPTEPGAIHWVEGWTKDTKWLLEVQLQKEYYKPYFAATEQMFVKPREYKIYDKLPGWATAKPEHFEGEYKA